MKKIILFVGITTLLVGTSAFARSMGNMGRGTGTYYQNCSVAYGRNYNNSNKNFTYGKNNLIKDKKLEENRVFIAERKVEIRKEMLKDTPDWNKIDRLNQEIAVKRTENQKYNLENGNYNCRFL